MTDAVHRENATPLEVEPVRRRLAERDATVAGWKGNAKEVVDADTEMMRSLLCEVIRLRHANEGLRKVLAGLTGPKPKEGGATMRRAP